MGEIGGLTEAKTSHSKQLTDNHKKQIVEKDREIKRLQEAKQKQLIAKNDEIRGLTEAKTSHSKQLTDNHKKQIVEKDREIKRLQKAKQKQLIAKDGEIRDGKKTLETSQNESKTYRARIAELKDERKGSQTRIHELTV